MFYSTTVLTKRGPLAKVWLAAHVSNKLTKAMALSTNISAAVTRIISPEAPMALRLTSQLLLGVVRIFSRKTKYLLADSSDALARLKLAYTPASANDLADAHANPAAITLADAGGHGLPGADEPFLRRRNGSIAGMPMPDLDFPETKSTPNSAPKYLADAKDITIDEYSGGAGIDSFGRDMDLDLLPVDDIERDRLALGYDDLEEEPLMFTPSQERSSQPSTPRKGIDIGGAESIERMRDAAMPEGAGGVGETPRLSFGPDSAMENPDIDLNVTDEVRSPIDFEGPAPERESTPLIDDGTPRHSFGGMDLSMGPEDSPRVELPEDNDLVIAEDEKQAEAMDLGEDDEGQENGDQKEDEKEDGEEDGKNVKEVMTKAGDEAQLSASRARKKRGAGAILWDEQTELSASFIRGCLQDTSDLVRPAKRLRVGGRGGRGSRSILTAKDVLARPVFTLHAPELDAVISTCFDLKDVKEPGSPITASGTGKRRRGPKVADDEEQEKRKRREEDGGDDGEKSGEDGEKSGEEIAKGIVEGKDESLAPIARSEEGGEELFPSLALVPEDEEKAGATGGATPGQSEPRFSFGGASPAGDSLPRMSLEGEVPLPVPSLDEELPLPVDDNIPHEVMAPSQKVPEDGALTLAAVASTQVVVKDADAEAAGELGDARMTNRALKMRDLLADHIDPKTGSVPFSSIIENEPGVTRRVAARSFYELLNLCSKRIVTLEQKDAYGAINVTPVQPAFDSVASPKEVGPSQ